MLWFGEMSAKERMLLSICSLIYLGVGLTIHETAKFIMVMIVVGLGPQVYFISIFRVLTLCFYYLNFKFP